jgi:hypothetical protein
MKKKRIKIFQNIDFESISIKAELTQITTGIEIFSDIKNMSIKKNIDYCGFQDIQIDVE